MGVVDEEISVDNCFVFVLLLYASLPSSFQCVRGFLCTSGAISKGEFMREEVPLNNIDFGG